jgi:hypothetical protein
VSNKLEDFLEYRKKRNRKNRREFNRFHSNVCKGENGSILVGDTPQCDYASLAEAIKEEAGRNPNLLFLKGPLTFELKWKDRGINE